MSAKVSCPALYDGDNQFLNNTLVELRIDSFIVGTEQKPASPPIPGYAATFQDTLRVADKDKGTFFLNMTLDQYLVAVKQSSGSNSPVIVTKDYTIAADTTTITDPALAGATLIVVLKGGAGVTISTLSLSGDVLTFPFTLAKDDVVSLTFYTT